MAFASGKTFTFLELLQAVDDIIANPAAASDPALKDKLDWLFAHFAPDPNQKQLLLSFPDHLKAALQKAIAADITIAPADIKLSAPHEAYLRLHAARLGLSDTQTRWLIDQQKQAAAAKAITDLNTQGVTTPDKTQIQDQIQRRINWDNRHTASLQRAVLRHDTRITNQLQQSFQRVINSQPTTIPQSEITAASRELTQLSYQSLKPYIPLISSPQDLTHILETDILTPNTINRVSVLASYKIPPDLFHQALEAAANNLYRRYVKPAQTANSLLTQYGESASKGTTVTIPPPDIRPKTPAGFTDTLLHTYGYPGETLVNAADPHAAENVIAAIPKKVVSLIFSPVRLVIGNIETTFVSLAITHQKEQVQAWAVNRIFPLLPHNLQQSRDIDQIQVWVRSQVRALHEGRLAVDFDTREKLLEVNNNLNVLEFGLRYRALLEKIPGVKGLLDTWSKFTARIPPVYAGYLRAWLNLAFRSDPLTAGYLLVEYGAIRPAVAGIWRAIVVPLTRHLPFGWDIKQSTFGMEAYWKPAKWAKDNIKKGLGWLAEKTGLRRAGEWVAQKIFKTTFAKLAAAFTGIATGAMLGWGFFKKSIKLGFGALFLFLITKGPLYAGLGLAGGLVGGIAGGIIGAKIGAAIGASIGAIGGPIGIGLGVLLGAGIGFIGGTIIGLITAWFFDTVWSSLSPWLTGSFLPGISQFFASLGTITFTGLPLWFFYLIPGGLIFYQIYQTNLRNTAMMAPALGGITGDHTGILPPGYVGPDVPAYLAVGNCPMTDPHYIGTGSYDPIADTGHGSTSYGVASYPIPIATMYLPECTSSSTCPFYGYAADIYPSDKTTYPAVAPPKICLENSPSCGDLTWTVNDFWFNCAGTDVSSPSQCSGEHWGWGVVLSASGNGNNWKIYLNHIDLISGLAIGQKFTSGQTIGAITRDLGPPSHLHIELNINGIPQKPDFLCQ